MRLLVLLVGELYTRGLLVAIIYAVANELSARGHGLEADIALGFTSCYRFSTTPLCNISHSALTAAL